MVLDDDFHWFYDGIIEFSGTFSSLSVNVIDAVNEGGQRMTFALPVAEPQANELDIKPGSCPDSFNRNSH